MTEPEQSTQTQATTARRRWMTRRGVIRGALGLAASALTLGGYAFAIEPRFRLSVTRYGVRPQGWTDGLKLRLALITDVHAGEPYMPASRIEEIVRVTNALAADVILLLGDFGAGHRFQTRYVGSEEWAPIYGQLKAPLGVHAVLGNHDWWDDKAAQRNGHGPVFGRLALEKHGIAVYENDVVRLAKEGRPFWLAGLGDQIALLRAKQYGRMRFQGVDDLPGTLGKITDAAPVILMAHEPDIFVRVPDRVALTVSGHTHGGQVRLFGWSPVVPSRYGNRYAYGHINEGGRDLIVSGGLGCSITPVRFGMPPEIVVVDLG